MGLRTVEQSDAARPQYLGRYRPCDGVEVGSEASVGALATSSDLAIRHGRPARAGPCMSHRNPMTNRFRRVRARFCPFGPRKGLNRGYTANEHQQRGY